MAIGRSSRLFLTATIFLFLFLVGCSGDDDAATTTETTTTSASASTTGSSTTAESTTTTSVAPTTTASTAATASTTEAARSTSSSTTGSSTTAATRVVMVYFNTGDGSDCSEVTAFERTVGTSIGPAEAAFEELVGGPTTAEEAAGASSFFSSATADTVRSVLLADGVLTVDFDDVRAEISNASSSCGSSAFTSSLNATAFQFPTVDKVRYLFAGSCEDLGEFLQTGVCEFANE